MANLITLIRIPLLGLIIYILYQPSALGHIIAAPLILVLIAMDSIDGLVARRRGETSLLGSVLDIAADRTVEFLLWVVFADLDMIAIVIPLVVLARGVFVDSVRSVAPARDLKPFELMRSPVGKFLVQSPWLRTPYALVKAFAFALLALSQGLQTLGNTWADPVNGVAQGAVWLSLLFCLVRGLPVLIEAPQTLKEASQ
jgi:CDP-diacylglycerol---glycerol-3-phosphate 3-phosphatidyltransferase